MFRQTYKATLKNLFRSGLFWFMVAILGGIVIYNSTTAFQISYKPNPITGIVKPIMDTSPQYELHYGTYIKKIISAVCTDTMFYAMPIFTVVSTVLILNRDYGDNFYEIEKSSGISNITYLLGRIAALTTVNFSLVTIASFASFHIYIITRGGLSVVGLTYYITDSTVRLMRAIVFMAFPTILFYIGITFLFGCILRSGLYASIISLGYIMFYPLQKILIKGVLPQIYADYLSPIPDKLKDYLYWYDTYGFNTNLSYKEAILAFLFQPAVFLLTIVISYLFTRKRDK